MKRLGLLLVAAGFLAGALVASQTPENAVDWRAFVPAVGAGGFGVVLARLAAHRTARRSETLRESFADVLASVRLIDERLAELDARKEELAPWAVYPRIDELFPVELARFVGARESIAHLHGLRAYADVMNAFAAGERYLNRAWSASLDGWVDELREVLPRAREQFAEARRLVEGLAATAPVTRA